MTRIDDDAVVEDIAARYGITLVPERRLGGGEESRVTEARDGTHRFVIRVSPAWRSLAQLTWAYELAAYAATEISEAFVPIRTRDEALAISHRGRVVSVFPFADGAALDRESARERDAAARLLARLHRVLPAWPAARARPASRADAFPLTPSVHLAGLDDADLDAGVSAALRNARPAIVHGDFYRGNLRCVGGRITAIFDWDDARVWTLEYELAWSVWEFAQAPDAPTLDLDRAERFLAAYTAAGGPASLGRRDVVALIRDGLRKEVRHAAALAEQGTAYDPDYIARARVAFDELTDLAG